MNASPESDSVLLNHIRDCIERVREYTGNRRATFDHSLLIQDAVVHNLQILAESTQRLSASIKATEPDVPWEQIAGFRNVLAHGYLQLDADIVWSVVENDLPQLAGAIDRMALATVEKGNSPDV
ncbi:MAG: hypothetical protein M2R45_05427 [Verrucomicrobia subdivision 3 bacterium]|nr:hypothetical protein [Limisphaerales bacterium]